MAIQPIQWRVKGLLPATGIAAIFGPSGSGKSFLAKDLGASIALGQDWFGHRTTRCDVTYVMLEAEGGCATG
jgi:RecA-family ATPase